MMFAPDALALQLGPESRVSKKIDMIGRYHPIPRLRYLVAAPSTFSDSVFSPHHLTKNVGIQTYYSLR